MEERGAVRGAGFRWSPVVAVMLVIGFAGISSGPYGQAGEGRESAGGIPPETVANWIHEVIQADRSLYTTHVVERMQDLGVVPATEGWKSKGALPLPAQMLKMAGRDVEGSGSGLRFRLASLWPIYEENGSADDFERAGLEAVAKDPNKPYSWVMTRGDWKFFKAIYADRAVSKACVDCHNSHTLSPKRDYKLYDVMGGVIISFPIK